MGSPSFEAGWADAHGLLVDRKRAVRDNHRFGRKSDNREDALSIPEIPKQAEIGA
jgi:hypothetical protein